MSNNATGIIFSNLNENNRSKLTQDRTVAAIPFGCRYRLVDFCLSNLDNANISHISIVANYNYRSLVDHIGSGKDWDLARRNGGINLISPFQTSHTAGAKLYSTHLEALVNMKEYVDEFTEDYVVLMDADRVLNLDISAVIESHEKSGAGITFVTAPTAPGYRSPVPRIMISSVAGKITNIIQSTHRTDTATEVSLNILVMKTSYLRRIIDEAMGQNLTSLTDYLIRTYKFSSYRAYSYNGYYADIFDLDSYYRASMELAAREDARESLLWKKSAPVYTKVHNSSPTEYAAGAKVENSMIADDCVIEGTVINSVLSRNVHVAAGAVVKNSVLFWGTTVAKGANVNCVVTDKDVYITENVCLSGNKNLPIYIEKCRKI